MVTIGDVSDEPEASVSQAGPKSEPKSELQLIYIVLIVLAVILVVLIIVIIVIVTWKSRCSTCRGTGQKGKVKQTESNRTLTLEEIEGHHAFEDAGLFVVFVAKKAKLMKHKTVYPVLQPPSKVDLLYVDERPQSSSGGFKMY